MQFTITAPLWQKVSNVIFFKQITILLNKFVRTESYRQFLASNDLLKLLNVHLHGCNLPISRYPMESFNSNNCKLYNKKREYPLLPFCDLGLPQPSQWNEQSKIPTQEYIPMHRKVCVRVRIPSAHTPAAYIYTPVGATSALFLIEI